MKIYRRLLQYLKPYIWPYFSVAMICMLGYSATQGILPFIIKQVFDNVFALRDRKALTVLPFVVVGVFAFRGIMNFGQNYLTDYIGLRIINDVRNVLHRHLQSLSLSFFQRHATGTLISRVNNDVALIRAALTDAVASLMRDTTSLIALMAVAFYQDWVLATVAFVVFPASIFPVMRLTKQIKGFTRRGQVATGTLTNLLQESIQGNRIVKAFGMEKYESERFSEENRKLFKQSIRASRMRAILNPAMELLASFGIGGVVWYGGFSVIGGGRTQGEFMAFIAAMFLMYDPFKRLARTYTTIQQGLVGAERVFEVLDEPPEISDPPGAKVIPPFSQEVQFHNVSFGYDGKLVLSNISFKVRAGEMVALVGMSGVGKSTLADLIPRFYDVASGKITIDEVDIRDVTLGSLRSQIGIVSQHTFLFNDTVKNNVSYGDPSKDMDRIVAAAKAAHAHDFIMAMPQGYDTVVGEMGVRLSGGQRQRLAIARALLKDAPILILDEATSSLDADSERLVQEALENLIVRRTTLVIAHRLSTIRKATRIVVLVDGSVAEEGTHEELLARQSEYNRLYTLQRLEDKVSHRRGLLH